MPRRLRMAMALDPSSGASKRSNFFTIGVVGLDLYTMKLHVMDMFRERVPIEEQADVGARYYLRWYDQGLRTIGIEAVFRQSEVVRQVAQRLRGYAVKVLPIFREKDKQTRLSGLAMRYSNRDITHPEDANGRRPPWVEVLEEELCLIGWEKGIQLHEFDDQADVLNDCCNIITSTLARDAFEPVYHKVSIDPKRERFPLIGKK